MEKIIFCIIYCVCMIGFGCYIYYLDQKNHKLLNELDRQIKLGQKISKQHLQLEVDLRNIKEEHLKEIEAINEVVRKQEEYVYDLEQKLKARKNRSKTTVKENEITTEIKTEKPKKTRKKGEDK